MTQKELSLNRKMVHLPIQPARSVQVRPDIDYSAQATSVGFGDWPGLLGSGLRHHFSLLLHQTSVDTAVEQAVGRSRHFWAKLRSLVSTGIPGSNGQGRDAEAEQILVGRLTVYEFPVRLRESSRNWFLLLDSIDGDMAELGGIADSLIEEAEAAGAPLLLDGSLFIPATLGIHPIFRGQELGRHLLAHGLCYLSRSMFDLALALAKPIRSPFDQDEPDSSANAITRLVEYYESIGFERTEPLKPIEDDQAVPLVAYLGESGLAVRAS